MLLGVAAVILGGFIIICGAPFTNSCLYKAGGGLFLTAGELSTSTYVLIFMIYHGINISVLKKTKKKSQIFPHLSRFLRPSCHCAVCHLVGANECGGFI